VHYVSADAITFRALQPNQVFDAGIDVARMLVYGHIRSSGWARNALTTLPTSKLDDAAMTLWLQQTGPLPTRYAIEVMLFPTD
jgi:catabolite regulation protein CreA